MRIVLLILNLCFLFQSCDPFVNSENNTTEVESSSSLAPYFNAQLSTLQMVASKFQESLDHVVNEKTHLKPIADLAEQLSTEVSNFDNWADEQGNTTSFSTFKQEGKVEKMKQLFSATQKELRKGLENLITIQQRKEIPGLRFDQSVVEELNGRLTSLSAESPSTINGDVIATLQLYQSQLYHELIVILEYFLKESSTGVLTYDKFALFAQSRKPYILLGETYEAEIGLGAYSSQAEFSAQVNGQFLRVEEGLAKFSQTPRSVGTQEYEVLLTVKNPLTGEIAKVNQTFEYEVGVSNAIVVADKMNVLYAGVDNPVFIGVSGYSTKDYGLRIYDGKEVFSVERIMDHKYIAKPKSPTEKNNFYKIVIWDKKQSSVLASFPFRVKRIPNPVARLTNNKRGGTLQAGEMHAQRGLMAILENFDFDARCSITGFTLYYQPEGASAQKAVNQGGAFRGKALQLIQQAKSGDSYQFMDIQSRCPGDQSSRNIGSMVFRVK